jgi:uncharacterized protein YjbJ (UPF0337 family)
MNKDILRGKWLEIKVRVKEKWVKITDNDFLEYGYIRDNAEPERRNFPGHRATERLR